MIFVKSEQEFLDSMWDKISRIEWEENEKQLAKSRNAKILKKNIITYTSMVILCFIILIIILEVKSTNRLSMAFILGLIALIIAYFLESRGLNYNENRDYH